MGLLRQTMLESYESEWPGSKEIINELDAEVDELIDLYKDNCLTEIHALKLLEAIARDLERPELPGLTKVRTIALDTYNMILQMLLADENDSRERWHKRHQLKEELRSGLQSEQESGHEDSGVHESSGEKGDDQV